MDGLVLLSLTVTSDLKKKTALSQLRFRDEGLSTYTHFSDLASEGKK